MKHIVSFLIFIWICSSHSSTYIISELVSPPEHNYDSLCLVLPETLHKYNQFNTPTYQDSLTASMDNSPSDSFITNHGATLGRVLFYDKNLSINKKVACASCHQQSLGFTDSKRFSLGFQGSLFTSAHSMRLGNLRYYEPGEYFWDRRATSLERQIISPIQDSIEMGFHDANGGLDSLVNRLRNVNYYPELFENAFEDDSINVQNIQSALSQFLRSLVSENSKWDIGYKMVYDSTIPHYGASLDFPNFTPEENEGKRLFMSLEEDEGAGCIRCHVPPSFGLIKESKSIGLDEGETTVFKSPSLRNVTITGPWFHDGRFDDLDDVLLHYAQQIKLGPSLDSMLIQSNGSPERIALNNEKRANIISFLHTLTDTSLISDERWSNPFYHCFDDCDDGKGSFQVHDNIQLIHQTSSRIPSHDKIKNSSKVIYKSEEIILKDNFEVELGSLLIIDIDPCNE